MINESTLSDVLTGRYRIERQLGAGGMATVYLAHDLKHGRDVAIKVLRPELAQSLTGERFLREIGITARLNHPHIVPLLDSGASDDGELLYYVMPVALGESLREHLDRDGAMDVGTAVRYAIDVAEALVAAHAMGVVHRDIKPDNVLISGGHAVLVDFGIAKAVGDARVSPALTMDGVSIGTPVYMAPEQAAGEQNVDHRADIYSVGAMLWEMCAGEPPFTGNLHQVLAQKLTGAAPSLAPKCPSASPALVKLVASCLAISPEARPQTADALLAELRSIARPPVAAGASRRMMLIGGAAGLAVILLGSIFIVQDRRSRWVRDYAVPNIQRLFEADQLDSAFALAMEADKRSPNDSALARHWIDISQTQTFLSEPSGATVTRAALDDTTRWFPVGTTPTQPLRIPNNAWLYRYTKAGYRPVTIMGARLGGSYVPIPDPVPMQKLTDPDSDMVLLSGAHLKPTFYGLDKSQEFHLANFLMNRLEVTNRQYQAFVSAGGYTKPEYWDSTIVRDGKPIAWADAMKLFVDGSGQPGPSSWAGGAPPADQLDFPVGGVSWYEARAFARYAKKELPTVVEWNAASIPDAARWVVPHGRYETTGPARGGDPRSAGPRGVYDLAGNVREWTANAREAGTRVILGGGWSDPIYFYSNLYSQPEFDRSAINGIRLVKRLGNGPDLTRAQAPIRPMLRDLTTAKPVDDATFKGYLALYDYDHAPFNTKVELRDSSESEWIREEVTIDSPNGAERLPVVMFLPRNAKKPYQGVVIWPASDALIMKDRKQLPLWIVDFIVRSGRAVIYPVYEGALGRKTDDATTLIAQRDKMLRLTKEMRRAIDYADSRGDVDSTRLGLFGVSWGGMRGPIAIAVEPRIKTAVLMVSGISMIEYRPEIDPVNFLPRVHVPALMLNGKYDSTFPYETSQLPFFRLLGSAPGEKKQIVYEGGHFLPRPSYVSETLAWFDKYLGRVAH